MSFVCPACGDTVSGDAEVCPKDGTRLGRASAPDPMLGAGGVVIDGRYRIHKKLGAGGIGAVYEGEHVEIGKRVAIKTLHGVFARTDEFLRRFEREARALSKLSHPGCVSVTDFGRVQKVEPASDTAKLRDMPYLVMEKVEGVTLAAHLQTARATPVEAVHITRGVLSALRHAHGLGIVHRDIKPGNIMLTDSGEPEPLVKLLDFGLAKIVGAPPGDPDRSDDRTLTQAGLVFGTPAYLSPEQAQAAPTSERSDLYSVGIVLYEMVCGHPPFTRPTHLEMVHAHANEPPQKPRAAGAEISPALEEVILRALAKKPEDRFASAEIMLNALLDCPEADGMRRSRTISAGVPIATGKRELRRWAPIAGGVVIAGVVLAIAGFWPRQPIVTPPLPTVVTIPTPNPSGPERRLMVANEYQRRLWCSDALEELDKAVREEPKMRDNAEVQRIAIACLTPKTQAKALRFIVDKLGPGPGIKGALEKTAYYEPNQDIRKGAQKALERLAAPQP